MSDENVYSDELMEMTPDQLREEVLRLQIDLADAKTNAAQLDIDLALQKTLLEEALNKTADEMYEAAGGDDAHDRPAACHHAREGARPRAGRRGLPIP